MQDGTGRASIALWWGKFLVLTLIGCVGWGGALGQEDDDKDDDDRRGVQDFSLSVSPSTGSVVQGQSRTYTVELSSIDSDGIDDEISLTVSGLGTGVTGTFSGSLSSADTSTRLTVRASPSASLTRRGFTVTGTADNGLTRTASGSLTVTARQPTSFSIAPPEVAIGECYTFQAGNAANMTLDLQYRKDNGPTQTIAGWPTLNSSGTASACPTLESQVGSYVFTAYRNTLSSDWITSRVNLVVLPERDFSMPEDLGSRTVYRDSTGSYSIRLESINGFSSAVTLRVSGLPTGVTGSFSPNPVTPTGTTRLTLTASSEAAVGADSFTITATGGGKTHTATATVVVPYFTLSMTPEEADVDQGSSQTFTVTVAPQHGFSRNVTLRVSELGTGLSGSFSRNPVTSLNWRSTLTIRASCGASRGRDSFTVTGDGGGHTDSGPADVVVQGFSVSNSPESQTLQRGGSVRYTTRVNLDSGFSSSVQLNVSGLPQDVTGRFNPNPARSSSQLTLDAGATAPLGRHSFTVTGTAHGCTDDDDDVIIVNPPPDPEFELSMTPESGNVDRGSSRTYTVTVDPDPGFTSDVDLSVSGLRSGLTWSFSTDPVTPSDWTSTLTVTAVSCSVSTLADSFTVTGTGGGHTDSDSDEVVPRTFSVSTSTENEDLERGAEVQYMVTVSPQSGFAASVALRVSGLPMGVTGEFNPTSTRSTSILTLRAMPNATLGRDTFTVTGTAHGCPVSTTDEVNVIDSDTPGFELSMTPESGNVDRGSSRTYEVEVDPDPGFSSNVTLRVSELGTGLTESFDPNPVTSPEWTSTLTLETSCNAALGEDEFKVTGTGGNASDPDTATVVVQGFSLSPPAESVQLAQGTSQDYTITVNLDSGFSSAVTLAVSDLPSGVSGEFPPGSTRSRATLTLRAGSDAMVGSSSFTVTGTAHGCAHPISVPIEITRPGFQVEVTPARANLQRGNSVEYTVEVTPDPGFSSAVTLSVSDLPTGVTDGFSTTSVSATPVTDPAWTSRLTLSARDDATLGEEGFTVTGTGGQITRYDTAFVDVVSTPLCALTLDPARARVAVDASQIYRVSFSLNTVIGTSADFALSVTGLPTGVTGRFSPESVSTSNRTSELTVDIGEDAPFGPYEFTVTGTGLGAPCTVTGIVEVTGSGFSLSVDRDLATVDPGAAQTYTVTVTGGTGFSSAVTLGVADLGPDFTPTFVPPAVTPTPGNPNPTSVLTLTASATVAPGRDDFSITGTSADLIRSLPAAIVVNSPPGFALSVQPRTANLTPGGSGTYTVTVSRQGEFSSEISLSTRDLGSDFTPTFVPPAVTPTPENPRPTSVLTLTASDTVSPVTDPFTITGTSGEISASTAATVVVADSSGVPDFTLSVAPADLLNVLQGRSESFTVEVTRSGGFSRTVDLSVLGQREGMTATFSDPSLSDSETTSELVIEASENFSGEALIYLDVQARSDTLDRTLSELRVVLIQGFHLQATPPASREIARGQSLTYTLNLQRLRLFTHRIHLRVEGLEANPDLTPSFSDAELRESESTSILTLTAGPNAPARTDEFTIVAAATASGQTITRSFTSDVTVTGGDFRVEVESLSGTAEQGSYALYTVTVPRTDNFMVEVQLSVSGLATGLTGVFYDDQAPTDPPTSSTPTYTLPFDDDDVHLKIAASTAAAVESHRFTITGTGGGLTRTTQTTVDVVTAAGIDIGGGPGTAVLGLNESIMVTLTGQNWKRAVDGVINVECGRGSEGHTAPCGNWGVSSNYSTVLEDTDQFRGWKNEGHGPTKLHWNSCTTKKAKYHPPNCEIYNDPPQGSMGECMRQKTRDFDDEAKSTVTHGSFSYRYDAIACSEPATFAERWRGCEALIGHSVGQARNHMTLYELDRARLAGVPVLGPVLDPLLGLITDHDLVRTLYFDGTTVRFEEGDCNYERCVEKTTSWKSITGYGDDGELHAIIDAELRMKASAELQGMCDWAANE